MPREQTPKSASEILRDTNDELHKHGDRYVNADWRWHLLCTINSEVLHRGPLTSERFAEMITEAKVVVLRESEARAERERQESRP